MKNSMGWVGLSGFALLMLSACQVTYTVTRTYSTNVPGIPEGLLTGMDFDEKNLLPAFSKELTATFSGGEVNRIFIDSFDENFTVEALPEGPVGQAASQAPSDDVQITVRVLADSEEKLNQILEAEAKSRKVIDRDVFTSLNRSELCVKIERNGAIRMRGVCIDPVRIKMNPRSKTKVFVNGIGAHPSRTTLQDMLFIVSILNSDSKKEKALSSFGNSQSSERLGAGNVAAMISLMSSQSYTLDALKGLNHRIDDPWNYALVLAQMNSQSYKKDALENLLSETQALFGSDQLEEIVKQFGSDSYKKDVIELLAPRISDPDRSLWVIQYFGGDSYKKDVLEMLVPRTRAFYSVVDIRSLLSRFTIDSYKADVCKLFVGKVRDRENAGELRGSFNNEYYAKDAIAAFLM